MVRIVEVPRDRKPVRLAEVEVLWPVPVIFESFGMTTIGYGGRVVLPVRLVPGAKQVVVDSEVREGKGKPAIPIKYSLYLGEDDWLVYDVTIDGVSLVSNYRSSFAAQVRRYRLDGLIERLTVHNQRDR